MGRHDEPTHPPEGGRLTTPLRDAEGQATAAARRRNLDQNYAIPTRDQSARQLTTGHCPAVPTRASQSDSRRCRRDGRPAPSTTTTMTNNTDQPIALDTRVHPSSTSPGTTSASRDYRLVPRRRGQMKHRRDYDRPRLRSERARWAACQSRGSTMRPGRSRMCSGFRKLGFEAVELLTTQ